MALEEKLSLPDLWDAGVDWLTMTWQKTDENFDAAKDSLENFGQVLNQNNFESKFTSWQGYTGWQFGKIFLGQRPDGIILRASGGEAKIAEAEIRKRNIAGKVTRIDYQVTAKDRQAQADYGSRVREEIESAARESRAAARRAFACYKNFGHDSGFVIGSRSSERFARFYNKTLEQRGNVEPGLWRYEIEYKGKQARYVWRMTQAASRSYWLAQSIVKTEFEGFGANMEFCVNGAKFEKPSSYQPSSVEKKLKWLETHVSKSVKELIDAGYREAVLEALGLTGLTT